MKTTTNKIKYQELLRYLFVGVLSTTISLVTYYLLVWFIFDPNKTLELQYANIISWGWAIFFGYLANRFFVFHSQSKNILNEIFSFIGSRIFALILDMLIMYIGVTIFHFNDILIKLLSQIIVIIVDYIIIKKLVFEEKKSSNPNYLYLILIILPIIDFLTSMLAWENTNFWFGSIIKGLIFIYAFLNILTKEPKKEIILLLISYFILSGIYIFNSDLSLVTYLTSILKIFTLPILLLYFTYNNNPKITKTFLVKIFYVYLLLLLIPKIFGLGHNISEIYPNKNAYLSFFYSGNELSATLLCLLPIVLTNLKEHHNWFTKLLGALLIIFAFILLQTKTLILGFILSVIYIIWHDHQKKTNFKVIIPVFLTIIFIMTFALYHNFKVALDFYDINSLDKVVNIKFIDKVILSSRLTYFDDVRQILINEPIREKVFGLGSLTSQNIKNVEIDLIDIYYSIGILGTIVYLTILIYAIKKSKLKEPYAFGFYLTLLISFLSGHILTSAMVTIWLACLNLANQNDQKEQPKILMVSNMYPSKKYKHYGAFVKNMTEQLKTIGYDIDLSIMHKHQNILTKLIAYTIFYTKTFIKSLFNSYDIIYVHFISHSTSPVMFAKRFTTKTKLILNAHGNDVISDYNFEEKNCHRSQKYIQESDYLVCSSTYFKNAIHQKYNYPLEKIIIYPAGGVNLDTFKPIDKTIAKQQLNLDPNTFYIGLVSRIEKDKGYDTLIEALYLLKEQPFMQNTKLIIIGSGNEQKKLNTLINFYHLENYIIQKEFVYQEDLATYYNAFDLFIFPTKRKSESLGLVGLEAMACQTFVIACDLYGPSEYLIDKENSLTYRDTATAKQLATKILEYLNLDNKTKETILQNASKTAQKFSDKNTINIVKEIFGRIL